MKEAGVISDTTMCAWQRWIDVTRSRCHLHFLLEGGCIGSHVLICRDSSRATAHRIVNDLPISFRPEKILEIGASVGFNSLAIAECFPQAEVHSVEPDEDAVHVAISMAADIAANYRPLVGIGEVLSFPDGFFDLIICHTVIEHVQNVPDVVREMSRVLSKNGIVHLEAPNYVWPYEPHLGVWCIPVLGKCGVHLSAWLQGKRKNCWYINHLMFVTPFQLERLFKENGLVWENRAEKKLAAALNGAAEIKKYKLASRVLVMLGKLGISRVITTAVVRLGLYPSVMFTLRKTKIHKK